MRCRKAHCGRWSRLLLLISPASASGLAGHITAHAVRSNLQAYRRLGLQQLYARATPRGLPVRRRSNEVLGLILVKDLVLIDEGLRVSDIRMRPLPFLRADTPMYDLLQARGAVLSYLIPPDATGEAHLCKCLCLATELVDACPPACVATVCCRQHSWQQMCSSC